MQHEVHPSGAKAHDDFAQVFVRAKALTYLPAPFNARSF
jgi:hypothetical protein